MHAKETYYARKRALSCTHKSPIMHAKEPYHARKGALVRSPTVFMKKEPQSKLVCTQKSPVMHAKEPCYARKRGLVNRTAKCCERRLVMSAFGLRHNIVLP